MINRAILVKLGVKELICDEEVLACNLSVPLAGRSRPPINQSPKAYLIGAIPLVKAKFLENYSSEAA